MFIFVEPSGCKKTLDCSTRNDGLITKKISFLKSIFTFFYFLFGISGGPRLSTYTVAECCLDFTLQVCRTSVEQLACQQAEGESSGKPHGAYPLWRWELTIPMRMYCEQGKYPQKLMSHYWHFSWPDFCSVVVFLLWILVLYDLVYALSNGSC
jgi:hypothetical protein